MGFEPTDAICDTSLAKHLHQVILSEYAMRLTANGVRKLRSMPGQTFCSLFGAATQTDPAWVSTAISIDLGVAEPITRIPNTRDLLEEKRQSAGKECQGETIFSRTDLCRLACAWLSRSVLGGGAHCRTVLLCDPVAGEEPRMALGVQTDNSHAFWGSYAVHAVASREDLEIVLKAERQASEKLGGVGDFRFCIAQRGVLHPRDLPPRWSLLEIDHNGRIVNTTGMAFLFKRRKPYQERAKIARAMRMPCVDRTSEVMLLAAALEGTRPERDDIGELELREAQRARSRAADGFACRP